MWRRCGINILFSEGLGKLHAILASLIETRHDRLLELIDSKRTQIREAVEEMRVKVDTGWFV